MKPAAAGTTAAARRRDRLQIRVTVDEHMPELYGWLIGLPATVRGRELLVQARLARAILAGPREGTAALDAAPSPPQPAQLREPRGGAGAAEGARLAQEASDAVLARLAPGFLAAVPPLT